MAGRKSNSEVTSKKAASAAAKVLSNPKSSKAAKTAAASALTQRPNRKQRLERSGEVPRSTSPLSKHRRN